MLKITTDGRKAALDIRLVVPEAGEQLQSKVRFCAENVYEIYKANDVENCTQLVFCDISTPKAEFNIYDELKRLLVEKGIPDGEIEFIHSYEEDDERLELFDRVNEGASPTACAPGSGRERCGCCWAPPSSSAPA